MLQRELVAILNLSSWCLVMVEQLFLAVPGGCLQFVIVVFPDHTHLLYFMLPSNVDPLDLQEEDELAHIIDGIFLILQMENFSFKKLALKIIIVQSPALSLRWSKRRGNQFLILNLH